VASLRAPTHEDGTCAKRADLITTLDHQGRDAAIATIRRLRENIQRGFAAVHGHGDSILFEIGFPDRRQNLLFRNSALIATGIEELTGFPEGPSLRKAFERLEADLEPWAKRPYDSWLLSRVTGVKALSREAAALVDGLSQYCSWC